MTGRSWGGACLDRPSFALVGFEGQAPRRYAPPLFKRGEFHRVCFNQKKLTLAVSGEFHRVKTLHRSLKNSLLS